MLTFEQFKEKYEGSDKLRTMNIETVYDGYMDFIKPYLPVISDLVVEGKVSEKQIRLAFGISGVLWNACKDLFEEFAEVLESKESIAQLFADKLLIDGVRATEGKNPKNIEMFQHRYNPKYKPKGDKVDVSLPSIKIEYVDASVPEEVVSEKYDKEIE